MSRRKISQASARRLHKENQRLREERESIFGRGLSEFPGININVMGVTPVEWNTINIARRLGFAVVVVPVQGDLKVRVYALARPS